MFDLRAWTCRRGWRWLSVALATTACLVAFPVAAGGGPQHRPVAALLDVLQEGEEPSVAAPDGGGEAMQDEPTDPAGDAGSPSLAETQMSLEAFAETIDGWLPILLPTGDQLVAASADADRLTLVLAMDAEARDHVAAPGLYRAVTCSLMLTTMVLDAGAEVAYIGLTSEGEEPAFSAAFRQSDCAFIGNPEVVAAD